MDSIRKALIPALTLSTVLLASCNGSDSGTGAPGIYSGKPSSLTGVYYGSQCQGTACEGTNMQELFGAVAPDGTGYFGSTCFVTLIPGLTSATSIKTNEIFLPSDPEAPSCSNNQGGPQFVSFMEQEFGAGSEQFSTPISVMSLATGAVSGETPESYNVLFIPYEQVPLLNILQLPGNYQGSYWGGATAVSLGLQADGTLSGDDALGCHIAGILVPTQVQNEFGTLGTYEYQVSANVTGPAVCAVGGIYGVAFAPPGRFYSTPLIIVAANADHTRSFAVIAGLQ